MPGRGRPRKQESSDSEGADIKTPQKKIVERLPDDTEVKNGRKKKLKHTEEKTSVQNNGEAHTTNHETQPADNKNAQIQAIKVVTCGAGAKTKKKSGEMTMKMQPDKPEGTSETKGGKTTLDEMPQDTMRRARGGKAKSETLQSANIPPVTHNNTTSKKTPNNTTKDSNKTKMDKACEQEQELTQKITKASTKPEQKQDPVTHEDKEEAAVNAVLHTTLQNLKIRKNERSNAALVVNQIIKHITKHLKEKSQSFKGVMDPLTTGSYYENLKISSPDEFDVMLPLLVERVHIEPFGDDGAFYSVSLKREKNSLQKFQESDVLSASKMLAEFREDVKTCVKKFPEWAVTKKKKGCPAVTLNTQVNSISISLDVVPCLMVKSSWPIFTNEGFKIEGWLGTKVKQNYKREPYYLVPKYEGCGTAEKDGVQARDVWRVSFSHIEKAIIKCHGSEKTCCEKGGARCCRKDCLKLLKYLLSLLKERDPSLHRFCSYLAKTTVLHACSSRCKDGDWRASDLSHCFQQLLEDFEGHLKKGVLNNFFIPSQNLLSHPTKAACKALADYINEERRTGFVIFKQFQNEC